MYRLFFRAFAKKGKKPQQLNLKLGGESIGSKEVDLSFVNEKMQNYIKILDQSFQSFKVGKANSQMFTNIFVPLHGEKIPLKDLANIIPKQNQEVEIKIYDERNQSVIETALKEQDFQVRKDRKDLVVTVAKMTKDQLTELERNFKKIAEETKSNIRKTRQQGIQRIKSEEPPEDDKKQMENQLTQVTSTFLSKIDEKLEEQINKLKL